MREQRPTMPRLLLLLLCAAVTAASHTSLRRSLEAFVEAELPRLQRRGVLGHPERAAREMERMLGAPGRLELSRASRHYYGYNNSHSFILLRPDYTAGMNVNQRKAVWIESGFEGNLRIMSHVLLLFLKYKFQHCYEHCDYDYYIVYNINKDGHLYAGTTDPTWHKTRERVPGTHHPECVGVDLLSNFHTRGWAHGDTDECSQTYRGPYPMSSDELDYQRIKKYTNKENILFSLSVSRVGSVITVPYAFKKKKHSTAMTEGYLNAFVESTAKYDSPHTSGVYSRVHGIDTGHAVDYNLKYGHSFNWAPPVSSTDTDNEYNHSPSQITSFFLLFSHGVMDMITYYESTIKQPTSTTSTATSTATTEPASATEELIPTVEPKLTTEELVYLFVLYFLHLLLWLVCTILI